MEFLSLSRRRSSSRNVPQRRWARRNVCRSQANDTFGLSDDAIVHLHGVGGLTVARLRRDLGMVSSLSPQVVILELGTNDLTRLRLEVAGSEIEDTFSVRVIGVCKVLPRVRAPFFNGAASILNQYLCGVLEPIPNVFCWRHRGFDNPSVHPYLPDGVYVNSLRSVSMVIFSIQLLVRLNFSFLILAWYLGRRETVLGWVIKEECSLHLRDIVVRVSVNFVSCNFSQAKTKNAIV